MYKTTSDSHDYLDRVGSHATKEKRTGRIDAIPAWAQEPEDYYNSLRDRWRSLLDQLMKVQEQLAEINAKLKQSLSFKEFEHLRQHKERLAARIVLLQQQQAEYRPLARAAGERAWSTVFFHVARTLLDTKDFEVLEQETEMLLERSAFEIRKGEGELTDEQRAVRRKKGQLQRRRRRYHAQQTGTSLVWSDESDA